MATALIPFLVADIGFPGLLVQDMAFTGCTATEDSQQDSREKMEFGNAPEGPQSPAVLLSCWAQHPMGTGCMGQPKLRTEHLTGLQNLKEDPA